MKKLNKNQKAKLKKGLLTVLHVIGYICIGFTVLMSILVGVNSCQPKQVKAIELPNNNLIRKADESYNYGYNDLYNINDNGAININSGDVYYFNNDSYINVGGGTDLIFSKTIDCQVFNSSSSTGVRFNQIALWSSSCVFALNGSGIATQNYHNSSPTFVVFIDSCTVTINSDYYKLLSFFNNILVKVDTYQGYLDIQYDITGLFNLDYYVNLVSSQWVNANTYYLQPYVLPIDLLKQNYASRYYFAPFIIDNGFVGSNRFYQFDFSQWYLGLYEYYSASDTLNNDSNVYFIPIAEREGQKLGYVNMNSGNYNYSFYLYCGCYKFHSLYKNFLAYCFEGNPSSSDYSNYYVDTNLNLQVNLYTLYKNAESEGNLNNGFYTVFSGGIFQYNAVRYDVVTTSWGKNNDGSTNLTWSVYYSNSVNGNVRQTTNSSDPILNCVIYRVKHHELFNLLYNAYDNTRFTQLNAYYDPYFVIGDNSGSAGDSGSSGLTGVFSILADAFTSVTSVLNIQMFGAFTIGSFVFLPLIVSIIIFIVNLFKR